MIRKRNTIWTQEQDTELLRLLAAGRPYWSIGAALGRSRAGVVGRLRVLQARLQPEANTGLDDGTSIAHAKSALERS